MYTYKVSFILLIKNMLTSIDNDSSLVT